MINNERRHAEGYGPAHAGWAGATNRGAARAARARRIFAPLTAATMVASAWLMSPVVVQPAHAQRLLHVPRRVDVGEPGYKLVGVPRVPLRQVGLEGLLHSMPFVLHAIANTRED